MSYLIGTIGLLSLMSARYLALLEPGLVETVTFLGGVLLFAAAFQSVCPTLTRIVSETSSRFYLQQYQEYVRQQEEKIREIQEEIMRTRQVKYKEEPE